MDAAQHHEQHKCEHIHEAVPANGERTNGKGDGVKLGMSEHNFYQKNTGQVSFQAVAEGLQE